MKTPKPRKLAGGQWFIQLRLNGVSIPVSAATEKECTRQAALIKAEYQSGKRKIQKIDMTIGEAIDAYIVKYEAVLSPATVRGYASIRKNRFPGYMDTPIKEIRDWQEMINNELKTKSEHTVKNGWGAVTAALGDLNISCPCVKLAKVPVNEMSFLEPEEIPLFLKAAEGDKMEIEMLLELHGLRESEAMTVVRNKRIDLKHKAIVVRGALVPNKENKFVEKSTNKSTGSTRTIPIMIPRLAELVQHYEDTGQEIRAHSASAILSHVHATCVRAGVTDVTNHGLRHTFASLGYSLGLSERMLMELGGWDDPATMHKIYIRLAARDKERAQNAMSDFFSETDDLSKALKELRAVCDKHKGIPELKQVVDILQSLERNKSKE